MSRLRGFQQVVKGAAYKAWADGARVVMIVIPTGGGKTVIMGDVARDHQGYGVAIAHRSELVGQLSVALAREGVRHNIIAPKSVIKNIVTKHMNECGRSYFDPRAKWTIASVDTLLRRNLPRNWLEQVTLVFQDEGHHVLVENKWGRAMSLFPNARGLFPTATPTRADGKGLGVNAHGLVDVLVEGPDMRWMIDNGYLVDYKLLMPTLRDFDPQRDVAISDTTGDYKADQLREYVKSNTRIIGDVVDTYLTHARGLRGITFAVDVEHATNIADAFNRAGVPARVVHAETPDDERDLYLRQLKSGELLQLVNVDLFGEGVDVPAVQVVSFARPTASYSLYAQQFGRVLRLMITAQQSADWDSYTIEQRKAIIAASEKPRGIIIDHVGNVLTHYGPPDMRKEPWTLEARNKRDKPRDAIPLRACVNALCLQPYERIYPRCPYCGQEPPPPVEPTKPAHVDGDIVLYTQEMLDDLFGAMKKIDGPCYVPQGVTPMVANSIKKNHRERQEAQRQLRDAMSLMLPPTLDERVANRRFFHTFGIDTLTAKTLGSGDAEELRQRIINKVTTQ